MKNTLLQISAPIKTVGLSQRFSRLFFFLFHGLAYSLKPIAYSLLLALPAFAEVTLKVTSSRPSVYLGETFNLTIEVNGADRNITAPDLSSLPPSDVQFLGQLSLIHI